MGGGDWVIASHWAPCPENGEPILMRLLDGEIALRGERGPDA
jgi:hypothetical protein